MSLMYHRNKIGTFMPNYGNVGRKYDYDISLMF